MTFKYRIKGRLLSVVKVCYNVHDVFPLYFVFELELVLEVEY